MIDIAKNLHARGYAVIPLPFQKKSPNRPGWQNLRLAADELPKHFNGKPQNIGVLLGEPSGWLVDIDLDHLLAVELADGFLPPTGSVFGRESKLRSHWLYRVNEPMKSSRFQTEGAGMTVEIRASGQTVFPGSTHPGGERIEWDCDGEPAVVSADALYAAVEALASAVRQRLGVPAADSLPPAHEPQTRPGPALSHPSAGPRRGYARKALAEESSAVASAGSGGRNHRLNEAAFNLGQLVGGGELERSEVEAALVSAAGQCGLITDDGEQTVRATIASGLQGGMAKPREVKQRPLSPAAVVGPVALDADGCVALGQRDPASGRLVLSPRKTLPTAEAFVREHFQHKDGRSIQHWVGAFYSWLECCYSVVEDGHLRKKLQAWLHDAVRYQRNRDTGEMELVPFESNPTSVAAALESIRSYVHLAASTSVPSWLYGEAPAPIAELLPCRSSLLHLPTMRSFPATPAMFATNAIDFDPDPKAKQPNRWLNFMGETFGDDTQSWDLLQEFFGYCLTCDTSLQKMLLLVGPKRSGKGTIARVLVRLIGSANVAGPTTSSLAGPFGLQPLLDKSVAIVSDARFAGPGLQTVVERLLCISGEDTLTVDLKYLPSVTRKLNTRFVFLTNELPRLNDASGALAGRFMMLRITQSFYGREDRTLTDKLMGELAGILNWAIEGWRRLRDRGRFVQPESVADAMQEFEDLSSPVACFVRECCDLGPEQRAWLDDLFDAWKRWCDREGRTSVSTRQVFGRDLLAAFPGISCRRNNVDGRFYDGIAVKVTASYSSVPR